MERKNMVSAFKLERERGKAEGIEIGRSVELFTNVNNLMDSLNYSREQAMDALKVSEEDRAILTEKFEEANQ